MPLLSNNYESGWSERQFLDNTRKVSLVVIALGAILLLANLVVDIRINHIGLTLGSFRLAAIIALAVLSYVSTRKYPHRIGANLLLAGLYLGFIVFPLLPYYQEVVQDLFLLLFLPLVFSIVPYMLFHLKRDRWYIWGWTIALVITSVVSFVYTFHALEYTQYNQLAQLINEHPMLPIGYGTSLVFINLMILYFKRTLENQRNYIIERNQLLEISQEEITSQRDHLSELNQTKDRIFSIIAHDLRSPLNTLQSLLSLFHDGGGVPAEQLSGIMNKIGVRLQSLSTLLNNMLYWAMSQMDGPVSMKPRFLSLHTHAKEIKVLFYEVAKDKNIEINNLIPNDLPPIYADADALNLVLRNLVANALKYTHAGGTITLHAEHHPGHLRISVQDTGVGMTEEQQKGLFSNQVATSELGTQNEKGTGLGLLITKEFLDSNGGTYGVVSAPGEGSTFWFTLPLKDQSRN